MLEYPLLMIFPVAMAFAAAFDLFTMTIPNRISLFLVAAFVVVAPLMGLSPTLIIDHIATGLIVLVAGFVMFSRGYIGGGDAKLIAAAALWLGFGGLLNFLVLVGVLGGALSMLILLFRISVPSEWVKGSEWLARLHLKGGGVPYGLAITGAALICYPKTVWVTMLAA
jgi:prepilin peptidase CpaA